MNYITQYAYCIAQQFYAVRHQANGHHIADDIFKHFLYENNRIVIEISLKSVSLTIGHYWFW